MKTKDFERAITMLSNARKKFNAASTDIVIDEMKLKHSDVRIVYGHTNNIYIIWTENGTAYSANNEGEYEPFLCRTDTGEYEFIPGVAVKRDTEFDLKF